MFVFPIEPEKVKPGDIVFEILDPLSKFKIIETNISGWLPSDSYVAPYNEKSINRYTGVRGLCMSNFLVQRQETQLIL